MGETSPAQPSPTVRQSASRSRDLPVRLAGERNGHWRPRRSGRARSELRNPLRRPRRAALARKCHYRLRRHGRPAHCEPQLPVGRHGPGSGGAGISPLARAAEQPVVRAHPSGRGDLPGIRNPDRRTDPSLSQGEHHPDISRFLHL